MTGVVPIILRWTFCAFSFYISTEVLLIQFTFVWRRGGSPYVRILFLGARYAALASAIFYSIPVRRAKLARAFSLHKNWGSWFGRFGIGSSYPEPGYNVAGCDHYHMFGT